MTEGPWWAVVILVLAREVVVLGGIRRELARLVDRLEDVTFHCPFAPKPPAPPREGESIRQAAGSSSDR